MFSDAGQGGGPKSAPMSSDLEESKEDEYKIEDELDDFPETKELTNELAVQGGDDGSNPEFNEETDGKWSDALSGEENKKTIEEEDNFPVQQVSPNVPLRIP